MVVIKIGYSSVQTLKHDSRAMSDPLGSGAREPTNGELKIMFTHIIDGQKEIKDNMATKEFVNAKFDSFNDRVMRVEQDVKEWIQTSTAAHVELDKDSKARQSEVRNEVDSVYSRLETQIKDIKVAQDAAEKDLRAVRTQRVNILLVAALGVVGNLVVLYISTGGFRP